MGTDGVCKYCLSWKNLIKAHIIPASFFKLVNGEEEPGKIYDPAPGVYAKNSHVGEYDKELLCADCESIFADWDNYAAKLLISDFDSGEFTKVALKNNKYYYSLDSYDYATLKLFFLSVLWRAHASSRPFFEDVNLGSHADTIKQMLKDKNPGTPQDYSVTLTRYYDSLGSSTISSPSRVRRHKIINEIDISLGSYRAFVKVDKCKYPSEFLDCCIQPKQLRILMCNLEDHPKKLASLQNAYTKGNK